MRSEDYVCRFYPCAWNTLPDVAYRSWRLTTRKWDPSWNDELRFGEKYGLHETKSFASESVGRWNCAVNWKLELSTPLPKAIPAGQPKQIAFHFPLYDPVARSERYRNMRFCGWTAVPYRLFLSLARQVTPVENSVLCASKEADALLGMGAESGRLP